MCIGVFIINRSCNGVVFDRKLDVEKGQGMFCNVVSKLESWVEIVGVVDKILQGFKRKGCSTNDIIHISLDEARDRAIVGVPDKVLLMSNEEAGIARAKFAPHCNTRSLKIETAVECKCICS